MIYTRVLKVAAGGAASAVLHFVWSLLRPPQFKGRFLSEPIQAIPCQALPLVEVFAKLTIAHRKEAPPPCDEVNGLAYLRF